MCNDFYHCPIASYAHPYKQDTTTPYRSHFPPLILFLNAPPLPSYRRFGERKKKRQKEEEGEGEMKGKEGEEKKDGGGGTHAVSSRQL